MAWHFEAASEKNVPSEPPGIPREELSQDSRATEVAWPKDHAGSG
jgi:hypothetical protein